MYEHNADFPSKWQSDESNFTKISHALGPYHRFVFALLKLLPCIRIGHWLDAMFQLEPSWERSVIIPYNPKPDGYNIQKNLTPHTSSPQANFERLWYQLVVRLMKWRSCCVTTLRIALISLFVSVMRYHDLKCLHFYNSASAGALSGSLLSFMPGEALTQWGWTIIGSDNGLAPSRRQVII